MIKLIYKYKTKGTCSRSITIDVVDGVIKDVSFEGGCSGNTQGVSALVRGMRADKVAEMLKDIKCGDKDTSCPAQLAIAITKALGADGGSGKKSREVRV
jgi:uncharacterized protein (TIGR03905 family)